VEVKRACKAITDFPAWEAVGAASAAAAEGASMAAVAAEGGGK
jgi:hypothetical protein